VVVIVGSVVSTLSPLVAGGPPRYLSHTKSFQYTNTQNFDQNCRNPSVKPGGGKAYLLGVRKEFVRVSVSL